MGLYGQVSELMTTFNISVGKQTFDLYTTQIIKTFET